MKNRRATGLKSSPSARTRVPADSLGRRLKQRILRSVVPQLAAGLSAEHGRRGRRPAAGPPDLQTLFDGSIVLTFRLLFLLHAEARGLLPIRKTPPGAASLQTIAAGIAVAAGSEQGQVHERIDAAYSAGSTALYDRLEPWFQIIPAATDDRLQRIARFLAEHRVTDQALALAIDSLARDVDARLGSLAAIDYRLLDVRHLGAIYESLLECKLVAAGPASFQLSRDRTERRATGAFYTPPAVVEHIVEQTVGAVLDEKLAALRGEFQAACAGNGSDTQELAERLLDVRVLDPAMGSGNFLLAAAEYITRRLVDFLAEFPASFVAAILGSIAGGTETSDRRSRIHRRVLERCIYGVDLDPLAVELAKFCLWLDGCQGDAPLPVLDQHLRCGNSLVGVGWHDLPAEERHELENSKDQTLDRLAKLRVAFDRLTATQFDVQPDVRFIHWELEFPEVFFDLAGHSRERLRHRDTIAAGSAGFDAVVGNPPYVDSETMTRQYAWLRAACSRTLPACCGNWDLFCAFIDRGLSLLNERGIWSQIVPNKLLAAEYSAAIQQQIGACTLLEIRDYSRASVFEDAGIYPIVPVIAKRRMSGDIHIQIMEGSDPAALRVAEQWRVPQARLACLPAGCWSPIVSPDWELLEQILENSTTLEAVGFEVHGAATVAEAYRLTEILHDSDQPTPADDEVRLLNSGTIDPFRALWGQRATRYLKATYAFPVVRRADLERLLPARARQAAAAKAIVAGMTQRIEAVFDPGRYLAGKSTTIIRHANPRAIELLVAILNSSVTGLAFRRLFESLALSGGYLRVGPPQLRRTLVPKCLLSAIAELDAPADGPLSVACGPLPADRLAAPMHVACSSSQRWPTSIPEACQRLLSAAHQSAQNGAAVQSSEVDHCTGFLFGLSPDQIAAICEWVERGQLQSPVGFGGCTVG